MVEYKGLKIDQEITFLYTYRGGYGRTVKVNGKVLKLSPKRCHIAATAVTKKGEEYTRTVWIDYKNIQQSIDFINPFKQ
jgi:hypothetical protein